MAETVPNYSPLAPAIGRVSADDRQRARAAGGPPRRPSPAAGDTASETTSHPPFECIALLLQGGGALGAYQAGVYEALAEADLHPDWIAGISIGAINGAPIAGNAPEARVDKLRAFWERVTAKPWCDWGEHWFLAKGDVARQWLNQISSNIALVSGASGFFAPRSPVPWPHPPGTMEATSAYDTSGLKATLEQLIDFDRINTNRMRFSVGAVNVRSGNFVYFDTATRTIGPEHIMASAALSPGFPAIEIEGEHYWDGGLVSNTPLQWLVDSRPHLDTLTFQVDLWSARGELPRSLAEVSTRRKEIQYSSRTRAGTDNIRYIQQLRRAMADLLDKLPEDLRNGPEAQLLRPVGNHKVYNIVHLIYRAKLLRGPFEGLRLLPRQHAGALARRLLRYHSHPAPSGSARAPCESRWRLHLRSVPRRPRIERDLVDASRLPVPPLNPVTTKVWSAIMSIQSILDRNRAEVVTIRATETVKSAADRMREHSIAALVVKSGDAITGLISEREIVYAVSRHGERALSMAVADIVTRATITIAPDDTLKRAMSLMTHHRVRHLPAIADGELVGIVSIGDVVKHRLEDLETESNVLRDAYLAAH
jgi:NTE family protein